MKIFLGIDPGFRDEWHVFPFAKTLATWFDRERIAWTLDPDEPEIDAAVLIQWATPIDAVERLRRRGVILVHRLDGRARSLVKCPQNDAVNRAVNRLADWTVYQSAYVREHTAGTVDTFFGTEGPIVQDPSRASIIYNSVDRSVFRPDAPRVDLEHGEDLKVLHVSFGSGVRKGVDHLVAVAELLRENPRVHFYCLGRQGGDEIWGERLRSLPNVTLLGATGDRARIAGVMAACDVLLFPSENDYCPNTVLEAMSCGLPVIYHDSGGTPELVRDGDLVAGVATIDANPAYPLYAVWRHLDEMSRRAVQLADRRFRMERMGEEYVGLIERLQAERREAAAGAA